MRGGLDHFGIEVADVGAVLEKLKSDYPGIGVIERPASAPFPGYLAHDPVGSIFAISEAGASAVPSERVVTANFSRFNDADPSGRYLHHYAIRCKRVAECADFYEDVFGFAHTKDDGDDPKHYLSDGKVSLLLIPWHINDYGGISVTGRGADHIGFKVEDAATMIAEILDNHSRYAPGMAPMWLFETVNRLSDESQVIDGILDRGCPMSSYHFTDRDGVFVAVGDRSFGEIETLT